jgi:hypothetical protein
MTPSGRERLLERFNRNPPAAPESVHLAEAEAHLRLPVGYSEFMRGANGGEGFVGKAYVILWRVEELVPLNQAYEVAEYAPGLFLFGSDGGGEAFAFDTRADGKPVASVPFVGMDLNLVSPIAPDFDAFLEALAAS